MVSAEESRQAIEIINQMIQGKRTNLGQRSINVQREVTRLLIDRDIERAVEAGSSRRLAQTQEQKAEAKGFTSVQAQIRAEREGFITGKFGFTTESIKTKQFPGVTLSPREKFFATETGTRFIVGRTPDLTIQRIISERETISQQPRFDEMVTFEPTPPSIEETKPLPTLSEELRRPDVTRPGTISEPSPEPKGVFVFETRKPTIVEKLRETAFRETARGETTLLGTGGGILAGTIFSVAGTTQFAKGLVTQPLETTGQTLQAITQLPKSFGKVGQLLFSEPAFVTGFVLGEVAQFKAIGVAQKLTLKGFDRIRTIRLKEIPAKDIIAPEFFKGQTFPQIRRGQSAGELLKEFKTKLPGELKPAGFTSAGQPLIADDLGKFIAGRGSSELPGLFQAPEISPRFLRIDKLDIGDLKISILGDTLRPSVFRITPSKFRLAPGIKESTRIIQPGKLPSIKKFFETSAKKGESIIPFIKTEKESVIPFGTLLEPTARRFFFKFEGRRIPIQEFKTAEGISIQKLVSAEDIAVLSSSSRLGVKSISVPEILSITRPRGTSVSSSIVSPTRVSLTPSFSKISSRERSSISSIISRAPTSRVISSRVSRPSKILSSIIPSRARSIVSRVSGVSSRVSRARPLRTPPLGKTPLPIIPKIFRPFKPQRKPSGRFEVLGRRFGKFKVIGVARTERGAIQIGRRFVGTTLAATFKIPKARTLKIPGFRTKKEDGGIIFIEPRKRRLKRRGLEVLEIQQFKKPRKRRRKK